MNNNRYKIILVLFNNPKRIKIQTEYAENAIKAAIQSEQHNPGYFCKSADINNIL